ncbi:outer membrane protein assembly factor BamD [Maribacter halichondriae]|uniref:outer membrane protein assembly factor BamD n=1 Tax=Maribacter halichondriae TaxID=2980554 RepID=UPI00307628F0
MKKTQEAAFMGAASYYELSPEYSLDQTDTDKALAKLQTFVNTYPDSEYFEEANLMAKELTTKQEKKAFEIARQFNKIGEFDYTFLTPAVSAFENFVSDYPGSVYREAALFYKFEAATRMALNSLQRLKPQRIEEAMAAYATLKKQFPETAYAKEAEKWLKKIDKESQNFTELSK